MESYNMRLLGLAFSLSIFSSSTYHNFIPCPGCKCGICHIFLSHSSSSEHWGCFHLLLLWIMLKIKSAVQIPESLISILFCIFLEVKLLNHIATVCLIILRNHHTVFHATLFYHSISYAQGFQLLHMLGSICYFPGYLVCLFLWQPS